MPGPALNTTVIIKQTSSVALSYEIPINALKHIFNWLTGWVWCLNIVAIHSVTVITEIPEANPSNWWQLVLNFLVMECYINYQAKYPYKRLLRIPVKNMFKIARTCHALKNKIWNATKRNYLPFCAVTMAW